MQWESEFRPKKFSTVRGQERAVRLVSGLSLAQSYKDPLLLCGSVGSGKTTLVRLFAMALNCERVDDDGSPCQVCRNCRSQTGAYLIEYNSPMLSAQAGRVAAILKEEVRTPTDVKVKVLFFDEAQGLGKHDQELMLTALEELPKRVAVCFATTERHRLSVALRSRCFEIDIGPIRPDVAIDLLKYVAAEKSVPYDLPALFLIVAAVPPQARDLIKTLQELHSFGALIDVPLVKAVCRLSVCDKLEAYVLALATRDRDAQTLTLTNWDGSWAEKMVWVVRFLTTVYYNDILGQRIVIDPLCYSMDAARWRFIRSLCERSGVSDPGALAEMVHNWLEFWSQQSRPAEDETALRFTLFEALVNNEASAPLTRPLVSADQARESGRARQTCIQSPWEVADAADGSWYIEKEDTAEIINRASYLMQEHGVTFNWSCRIEPPSDESQPDAVQFESILGCCQQLSRGLPSNGENLAAILSVERNGPAIVGRLAAWIPDMGPRSKAFVSVQNWQVQALQQGFKIQSRSTMKEKDLQFHWRELLNMCAGFDGDGLSVTQEKSLRQLLNIPRKAWRQPGPFKAARLVFAGKLTSAAIRAGSENGMMPPSAFDASVWPEIISGWELKEHPDRKDEAARRSKVIAHLEEKFRNEKAIAEAEIADLRGWWASQPLGSWPRTWLKQW